MFVLMTVTVEHVLKLHRCRFFVWPTAIIVLTALWRSSVLTLRHRHNVSTSVRRTIGPALQIVTILILYGALWRCSVLRVCVIQCLHSLSHPLPHCTTSSIVTCQRFSTVAPLVLIYYITTPWPSSVMKLVENSCGEPGEISVTFPLLHPVQYTSPNTTMLIFTTLETLNLCLT